MKTKITNVEKLKNKYIEQGNVQKYLGMESALYWLLKDIDERVSHRCRETEKVVELIKRGLQ